MGETPVDFRALLESLSQPDEAGRLAGLRALRENPSGFVDCSPELQCEVVQGLVGQLHDPPAPGISTHFAANLATQVLSMLSVPIANLPAEVQLSVISGLLQRLELDGPEADDFVKYAVVGDVLHAFGDLSSTILKLPDDVQLRVIKAAFSRVNSIDALVCYRALAVGQKLVELRQKFPEQWESITPDLEVLIASSTDGDVVAGASALLAEMRDLPQR